MHKLLQQFNIDQTFTQNIRQTHFNKIDNNIPFREDYNQMADILMLPETKLKYKYLLVIVDLATHEFDCEPMRDKTAEGCKSAMIAIYKRPYVKLPYASLKTDNGGEFKGVFHKYLYQNDVLHKLTPAYHHKGMSMVENLNALIGQILIGYMNYMEEQTQKRFTDWTDILPKLRKEVNKFRKVDLSKKEYTSHFEPKKEQQFQIGDIVYPRVFHPEDALNNKQTTANWRKGDARFSRVPKRIIKVIYMFDFPYYRYILKDIPNISYSEFDLKFAPEEKVEKYKVKAIINSKTEKKIKYYLVWWQGELKKNSTWEKETELIEDGLQDEIDAFKKPRK